MTSTPDPRIAIMAGDEALPRKNGELVFQAPWEGRAFGMAVALNDRDVYRWDEFRERLIAEIAAAEANASTSSYYERWLSSFESLLVARGLLTREEVDARAEELADEDDHDHDHDGDEHHHGD
jgi:nitrile hydratase accessory protein